MTHFKPENTIARPYRICCRSIIKKFSNHISFSRLTAAIFLCVAPAFFQSTLKAQMIFEGLTGPVTQNEINAFKNYIKTVSAPTYGGNNVWVFGSGAKNVDACGLMYDFTKDLTILDRMIYYCDVALSQRNDLNSAANGGQLVTWTGNVDCVWPTGWCVEPAAIVDCMAYCAKLIFENPSIWNTPVGIGDSHGYGSTYKARALKYMREGDYVFDHWIIPYFVRTTDRNRIYFPGAPNTYKPNEAAPWNQLCFVTNSLVRLTSCHLILNDDPSRVALYDGIAKPNLDWFFSSLTNNTSSLGTACKIWAYAYPSGLEDTSHAAFDMEGIFIAYSSGRYGIKFSDMVPFANTFLDIVLKNRNPSIPENYAGYVNGTSGTGSNKDGFASIKEEYLTLSEFRKDAYNTMATIDINKNVIAGTPQIAARLLWQKNRNYKPIAAPNTLTSTVSANSKLDLSWTDNAINEGWFRIEKSSDGSTGWIKLDSVPANVTTYSYLDPNASTTNYYRVCAANISGTSGYSNVVSNLPPNVAPVSPTDLKVTTKMGGQDLSWTDISNNETTFRVESSLDGITNWTLVASVPANVTTYYSTGLNPLTTYYYHVRAENAYGISAYTGIVSATTLDNPPSVPTSLVATAIAESQINITWSDNSNNETAFLLERSLDNGATWTLLTTLPANITSYSNTDLDAGFTYNYRVFASNDGGNSVYSNMASTTTLNSVNPPSDPSNLNGTVTPTQVTLHWMDNSKNETLFRIEQSLDGTNWSTIGTVATNVTNFVNTGLTASTKYYYRLRAENSVGNSSYTEPLIIIIPSPGTNISLNKAVTVSNIYKSNPNYNGQKAVDGSLTTRWATDAIPTATLDVDLGGIYNFSQTITTDYKLIVNGYKIQYWNGYQWADAYTGDTLGVNTRTDYFSSVTGSKVRLNIFSIFPNKGGPSIWEFAVYGSATTVEAPASPSDLIATNAEEDISLAWSDHSEAETFYIIESSSDGANWIAVDTVGANTMNFTVEGLSPQSNYYYRICAGNLGGRSGYSNTAAITTPSSDATLYDLKVEGTTIAGFNANTLTYNIESASAAVPLITATANEPHAFVTVNSTDVIPGTTTIDVTAQDGTTSITYFVNFTGVTGLHEINENTVKVCPTQVLDELTVEVPESFLKGKVLVYDVNGRLQIQKMLDRTKFNIDLSDLTGGAYLVKIVRKDEASIIKRITKK